MSIKLPLDRTRSFTRPLPAVTTITSRVTIQNIAFSDRHPNIASSPNASCPTNSILSDIGTLISSLHSQSITHHCHLPKKSWQCLPNPVQSVDCYLQEAQRKSTGAPLPSDPQDPHFERVVQYIIADPTAIFRCPHLHIEAHNTMNKDCAQTLQDLWSLVEKQRAHRTSPEFFKKYNIT